MTADNVQRLSIDCKATVLIGAVSRGGLTRGDNQACDHDLGLHEKDIPCGIVDEESGQLRITFGSSYKTSDFIMDALEAWWAAVDETEQVAMALRGSGDIPGPFGTGVVNQTTLAGYEHAKGVNDPVWSPSAGGVRCSSAWSPRRRPWPGWSLIRLSLCCSRR